MKFINALVVKLVDTKDLKAEGFTSESVYSSPRQSKHPIKSHNFNLTEEELIKEIELHDKKLEILGNIINSEEKVQNQGMTSVTLICKKRDYSN